MFDCVIHPHWISDIDISNAQNLTSRPQRRYLDGDLLDFGAISSNDAGIGTQYHQSSYLAGADGARSARAEQHLAFFSRRVQRLIGGR